MRMGGHCGGCKRKGPGGSLFDWDLKHPWQGGLAGLGYGTDGAWDSRVSWPYKLDGESITTSTCKSLQYQQIHCTHPIFLPDPNKNP